MKRKGVVLITFLSINPMFPALADAQKSLEIRCSVKSIVYEYVLNSRLKGESGEDAKKRAGGMIGFNPDFKKHGLTEEGLATAADKAMIEKIDAFDNKVKTAGMYANERKREYYRQCVDGA